MQPAVLLAVIVAVLAVVLLLQSQAKKKDPAPSPFTPSGIVPLGTPLTLQSTDGQSILGAIQTTAGPRFIWRGDLAKTVASVTQRIVGSDGTLAGLAHSGDKVYLQAQLGGQWFFVRSTSGDSTLTLDPEKGDLLSLKQVSDPLAKSAFTLDIEAVNEGKPANGAKRWFSTDKKVFGYATAMNTVNPTHLKVRHF